MPTITIYTDGSSLGNPGPGGYGVVMISGPHRKEMSQGFRLTTNNRMELLAVCVALEALKFPGSEVTVFSDSRYVVDAVSKGWVFVWVKGHAETAENNRCDMLAVAAANGTDLPDDAGYQPE